MLTDGRTDRSCAIDVNTLKHRDSLTGESTPLEECFEWNTHVVKLNNAFAGIKNFQIDCALMMSFPYLIFMILPCPFLLFTLFT